jgi:hypothetical protein
MRITVGWHWSWFGCIAQRGSSRNHCEGESPIRVDWLDGDMVNIRQTSVNVSTSDNHF